jgi:hypothetical protein
MMNNSSLYESILSDNLSKLYPSINRSDINYILNLSKNQYIDNADIRDISGPSLWANLHWMGLIADLEGNPRIYWDTLSSLLNGHPCKDVCRGHLASNLLIINPDNYKSLFMHSFDLHNYINKQLGKPIMKIEDAKKIYNADKCTSCRLP